MDAAAHTIDFSSVFPPNFIKDFLANVAVQATEGLRAGLIQFAPTFWQIAPTLAILLVIALIIAFFDALAGNWEMLGSLLNRIFLVAGIVAVVSLGGLGIFFSDYFEIILSVLGAISFWLVGRIIRKFPRRSSL